MRTLLTVVVVGLVGCAVVPHGTLPENLTAQCPIAEPKTKTLDEAVRVATERKAALYQVQRTTKAHPGDQAMTVLLLLIACALFGVLVTGIASKGESVSSLLTAGVNAIIAKFKK